MTTALTNPVVDTVTNVTVENWSLKLRYTSDFALDQSASEFEVIVADRRADGSIKQNRNLVLVAQNLSAGQRTVLRNFHAQVIALARAAGLIPAGSDSQDI